MTRGSTTTTAASRAASRSKARTVIADDQQVLVVEAVACCVKASDTTLSVVFRTGSHEAQLRFETEEARDAFYTKLVAAMGAH